MRGPFHMRLGHQVQTVGIPGAMPPNRVYRGRDRRGVALRPGLGDSTYTRSASLFDLIEQRLAAPGSGSGDITSHCVTSG
jgi:hypothetical protein